MSLKDIIGDNEVCRQLTALTDSRRLPHAVIIESRDRNKAKAAVKELRAGRCVGIFPEGTRSKDGEVHNFGAGVALLASMSGAPVVPAAILGTNKMKKLRVIYGEPMTFEGKANRETLDEFSKKIREEVVKMKKMYEKE